MSSSYKKDLDNIIWSFSTLNMYDTCPYSFYLYKIEQEQGDNNFYAENGKLMHEIFEKLENGKLSFDEAPSYYQEEFEYISSKTKETIMNNTFDSCINYLCEIDENILSDYEVVWVEEKVRFKLGKRDFIGFVDLLLKDKKTGDLILVDHKSSEPFFKKTSPGEVLKSQQQNFDAYSKQMYLYCRGIYERFGKFPQKIVWHHFKRNGALSIIDFKKEDYDSSLDWAKKTILKIYRDKKFLARTNYMQCWELCNYRKTCPYKNGE